MAWWKDLTTKLHMPGMDRRDVIRILAVMPYDPDRQGLLEIAGRRWHFDFAATCESALKKLAAQKFAIILCDRDLPDFDWRHAVEVLAGRASGAFVILASPVNDDYLWQEVIQRGGYDVVTKPFQEERVRQVIDLAWARWTSEKALAQ